ncbi:MAG: hypothetical protein CR979_02300 [Propionibacterium sp.]|nr:MAG: hypothetical protein CR979_02300 [Propionibacterium sp.]
MKRLAVLLSMVFLLTACHFETEVMINNPDNILVEAGISMDKRKAKQLGVTTDALCKMLEENKKPGWGYELKETKSEDEHDIGCKYTAKTNLKELKSIDVLDLEDGVWKFNFKAEGFNTLITLSVKVTFPGEVLTHSGNSKVEGTTVIWEDPEDLQGGVEATAKDSPLSSFSNTITIIGVLAALAVIAVVIFVVVGKRNKTKLQKVSYGQPQPYSPEQHRPEQPSYGQFGQSGYIPNQSSQGYPPADQTRPNLAQPIDGDQYWPGPQAN